MAEISAAKRFFLDRPLGFRTIDGKRTWALDGFLGFWGMVTASALTAVPITKLTGHTKRLIDSDSKPEAEKLASRLFKSKAAGDVPTMEPAATEVANATASSTANTSPVSETQSEVANG
jgi:hypothetical protein